MTNQFEELPHAADMSVDYPEDSGRPPPVYPGAYQGYPVGYSQMPYQYRPGTNGKAVAGLVLSLVGLPFCGITSVPGLVFSIVAMRETKRTGQSGHGLAIAGAIIGGIVTGLWSLYWLVVATIAITGWQWI